MTGVMDDRARMIAHRRFLEEVEMAVRAANQEIIGQRIPHLDRKAFFRLAVSVARLRADYLKAVMSLEWDHAGPDGVTEIQNRRRVFEEARDGFEALQHAFERGYVAFEGNRSDTDDPV